MIVSVICKHPGCSGKVVAGPVTTTDPQIIGALMLAAHACPPHSAPHELEFQINGSDPVPMACGCADEHELEIRCIQCGPTSPTNKKLKCVSALFTAHAIAFHSAHEGHPFEMFIDGKKIH